MTDTPTPELQSAPKERPGGRSERIGRAVLDATIALLVEDGAQDLSLEAIAGAAGINRTTLYRRWGSKPRLLTWVLLEYQREHIPQPDTGILKDFWEERDRLALEILDRAKERGELPADLNGRLLLEMILAHPISGCCDHRGPLRERRRRNLSATFFEAFNESEH